MKFLGTITMLSICIAATPLSARPAFSSEVRPAVIRLHLNVQEAGEENGAIRVFAGTITKNGDQFVLSDSKNHKWYELDDQTAAGKFEGKTVKITGTLDTVRNVIRIQSIAEAAT